MASSNAPTWPSIQPQEYAAAESMLQHSRSARSNPQAVNGFALPDSQSYGLEVAQSQPQINHLQNLPMQAYPHFRHPFQPASVQDSGQAYDAQLDTKGPSAQDLQGQSSQQGRDSYSDRSHGRNSTGSGTGHRTSVGNAELNSQGQRTGSVDGSESTSPADPRGLGGRRSDGTASWEHRSSNDGPVQSEIKDEAELKPAWSELKTKAGKERKRLPLACIACRRKKIRCSGDHPACRHCTRSRTPCVYKVTTRKAAPRTDYMAMLDKRLKRMEERVIKIIPKEDLARASAIPRANIRPSNSGQPSSGKKRGAEEAFGSPLDDWAGSKANSALKGRKSDESKINTEGLEYLPSKQIQEHLSEVFFDYLYGQTYHLMHKPSYMRRLRAGTLPPVLILAVCAVSARLSTHPQINSEPAYLRGESWATRARDIVLKRYDEPNITILTVTLLLAFHEFGTCQGGRSWMFAGMATRMAYALQLHREMDHDPLGRKNEKDELSFTDREIRRRTMWACFIMDRFNSSGTERPMFADEEDIKVQLPIKESLFQMEIPGPTEDLYGHVPNPVTSETGQLSNPKDNMGVAAYMVRIIVLWGRVIKYMNRSGKQKDPYPVWDPKSQFADLRKQADDFKSSLPPELKNIHENLQNHAAEKIANQFIFLHVASNQVVLFLNRFAILPAPGGIVPQDMPKDFVAEAAVIAVDAAEQISILLTDALKHHVYAPFVGYCAFSSSTVHVWAIFSGNATLKASSGKHLGENVHYLSKMKRYWGMFQFMTDNLKDMYRHHQDAFLKGNGSTSAQDTTIFHYGDWFTKYPHGLSETDPAPVPSKIKRESKEDAALSQPSSLQSVEEFFRSISPTGDKTHARKKPARKAAKIASQPPPSSEAQVVSPSNQAPSLLLPHVHKVPPPAFPPPRNQPMYPSDYSQIPASHLLLPQLDRHFVYNAYAGTDPDSTSVTALHSFNTDNYVDNPHGDATSGSAMWNPDAGNADMGVGAHAPRDMIGGGLYGVEMSSSAWFMPFNLNAPDLHGGEMGFPGRGAENG